MKKILLKTAFIVLFIVNQTGIFSQSITIDTVLYENVTCFGADDGIITIIPSESTFTYEYSIDAANTFHADSIFYNLAAGEYNIAIKNANDTAYYSQAIVITQPDNVEIDLGYDLEVCEGYIISVADTFDTYSWSTGNTANTQLITETGTYYLSVTDGEGTCGFDDINVTVYDYPDNTLPDIVAFCEGGNVQLEATGGTNYLWSTGETTSTIIVSPDISSYYFVTVTNIICYTVDSVFVEVHEFYNEIVSETTVCNGSELELIVESYFDEVQVSDDLDHLWSFGSVEDTATIILIESGYITVTSTYINGCISTDTVYIEVFDIPLLSVIDTQTICSGGTATLIATGGDSYLWSNGETNDTITITPTADTTTLTVIAELENGCTATGTSTVIVSTANEAYAGEDKMVCFGSATYLNAYGGDTFTWLFDGDTIAETQCVQIEPEEDGNYIVHVESGTCSDSDTVFVGIYDLPVVNLGQAEQNICEGSLLVLSPTITSDDYIYEWSTGESTDQIMLAENSIVSLTITDVNGCVGQSASVTVTVIEIPELSINGNTVVCQDQSIELTVSGADNYLWNTGSAESTIIVTPTDTTIYSVYGFTEGCYAEASIEIIYIDSPISPLSLEDELDFCGSGSIDAGEGYFTYLWSTDEITNEIVIDMNGTYAVTVTNESGCSDSDSSVVTILEVPEVELGEDIEMQYSGVTVLSVPGNYEFEWSTGSTEQSIVLQGSELGQGYHDIWVIATADNGCSDSDTINVYVGPPVNISGLNKDSEYIIYPNPSNGVIYIEMSESKNYNEIQIINAIGQIVIHKKLENRKEEINLDYIEKGVYIIKLLGKDINTVEKITIY